MTAEPHPRGQGRHNTLSAAAAPLGDLRRAVDAAAGRPCAALRPGPAAVRALHGRRAHGVPVRPAAEPAPAGGDRRHHRRHAGGVQDLSAGRPSPAGPAGRRAGRGRRQGHRSRFPVRRPRAGRQRAAADRRHPARQGQDRAGCRRRARRPHAGPAREAAGLLARGRPSRGLRQPGHGARFGRPLHGPALRRRHAGVPQELCRAAGRKRRRRARRMAAAHCLAAHAARRLRRVPHHSRRDAAAARPTIPWPRSCARASRTRSCSWAAPCARSTRT